MTGYVGSRAQEIRREIRACMGARTLAIRFTGDGTGPHLPRYCGGYWRGPVVIFPAARGTLARAYAY